MLDFIKSIPSKGYEAGSSLLSTLEGKIAAGFFAVKTAYNLYNNDSQAVVASTLTTVGVNAAEATGVYFASKLAKNAYNNRQANQGNAPAPAPAVDNGAQEESRYPKRKRKQTKFYG